MRQLLLTEKREIMYGCDVVCSVQGNLIGTLSGHGSWVLNVAFCPDNVHFVSW